LLWNLKNGALKIKAPFFICFYFDFFLTNLATAPCWLLINASTTSATDASIRLCLQLTQQA